VKRRLIHLLAGVAILWLLSAGPAYAFGGETGLLHSAVAALLCLVPMAVTQVWSDWTLEGKPEQQLAAVFGGTSLRMGFVLILGMVLYFNVPEFQAVGFWIWVVVFYLVTLALEIVLVLRRQAELDAKQGAPANRGAVS